VRAEELELVGRGAGYDLAEEYIQTLQELTGRQGAGLRRELPLHHALRERVQALVEGLGNAGRKWHTLEPISYHDIGKDQGIRDVQRLPYCRRDFRLQPRFEVCDESFVLCRSHLLGLNLPHPWAQLGAVRLQQEVQLSLHGVYGNWLKILPQS
jgi:hypothetical protein